MTTPRRAESAAVPALSMTFLALALVSGCECGSLPPVGGACAVDADCAGGACVAGVCATVTEPDASIPEADAGEGCAVKCGTACCGDGETCELGTCRKDCGAAIRCGEAGAEACCGSAQLCFLGACITPGAPCATRADCLEQEYCDPSVGKCLPLTGSAACEYRPPSGNFAPSTLWGYTPTTDAYTQVMMSPIVVDVNGDQTPDVLANFFTIAGGYNGSGVMRALSGDDGRVLWTTSTAPADLIHPPSSLAAGDLDGSGNVVVLAIGDTDLLQAYDGRDGKRLWSSRDSAGNGAPCRANWGGPSLADLDGDGRSEIVCGLQAFDHTGLLLWSKGIGSGAVGPIVAVVDLDGDGRPEITDGAEAYRGDGSALGWTGTGARGLPAAGDFLDATPALLRDGKPELVVVGAGAIHLVNGQTGSLLASSALPSWDGSACRVGGGSPGTGGPPTVADFDGDGQPEVGIAALTCYSVFELELQSGAPAWKLLWSKRVQDRSSSVTGSSVFDFEGDGKAEVVYADELALHVFRGSDGEEIFNRPHCSGTTYEYPVIVDVNANGRADIVISENTYGAGGLGCDAAVKPGIQVFNDAQDNWVNTRQIWNQHAYHVTNVCDGVDHVCGGRGAAGNTYARIPARAHDNWRFNNGPPGSSSPPLNNYRQNVQGDGLFNAPDLTPAELHVDRAGCPDELKLSARVVNKGALGVLAGLSVAFYLDETPRQLIGVGRTKDRLLPGQSELVTISWQPPRRGGYRFLAVVDDDGTGKGASSECDEANNTLGPVTGGCVGLQ